MTGIIICTHDGQLSETQFKKAFVLKVKIPNVMVGVLGMEALNYTPKPLCRKLIRKE